MLPDVVPSSPNPKINKAIESANGHSIKEEFFNRISPNLHQPFNYFSAVASLNARETKTIQEIRLSQI